MGKVINKAARELSGAGTRLLDRLRGTYALHYSGENLTIPPDSPVPSVIHLDANRDLIFSLCRNFAQHKFDVLGSGWVKLSTHRSTVFTILNKQNAQESERIRQLIGRSYERIDWRADFKSGYTWDPNIHYTKIRFGHLPGVDVKTPWELARMRHLPVLALAYALSAKEDPETAESFAVEFRNQILDFVSANPPRFGVNWACAMDVAIRVVNWVVGYHLFEAFGAKFDGPFRALICRSAYEHGLHIINNLEYSPDFRANHYLANIVGLLFAASYLPRSDETSEWLAFGIRELVAETSNQFLPDGLNFEASVCYHGLAAEMVLVGTALILGLSSRSKSLFRPENSIEARFRRRFRSAHPKMFPLKDAEVETPFSSDHFRRLKLIAEATAGILDRDFRAPQIGDNDSGRLLKIQPAVKRAPIAQFADDALTNRPQQEPAREHDIPIDDDLDFRHLLAGFSGLFGEDFGSGELRNRLDFDLIRFLANGVTIPCEGGRKNEEAPNGSFALTRFPDFGLYVYKSGRIYFNIRCGSLGQRGRGGHAHNDQLSVELSFRGVPIIVDSGTFCYTSRIDMRNFFRSTAMHNTLLDGDKEQNPWRRGLSGVFRLSDRSRADVVVAEKNRFVGRHFGFGYEVVRTVNLADGAIEGRDQFLTGVETPKSVLFHTAPGLEPLIKQDAVEVSAEGVRAIFRCVGGKWFVEPSMCSPGYGILLKNKVIRLTCAQNEVKWSIELKSE